MSSTLLEFGTIDPNIPKKCRLLSLKKYEINVQIGVHDFEKIAPQRMWFNVDLCINLLNSQAKTDKISETINYDIIRDLIKKITTGIRFELQETICDAIGNNLIKMHGVYAARVFTQKPDVYPDCESVGVERVFIK